MNYIFILELKFNGPTSHDRKRKGESYFIKQRVREMLPTDTKEQSGRAGKRSPD